MNFSIARQQLHRLIQQIEPFRLAEAALYIAQEEYPELDIQAYLAKLDHMAQVVKQRLPDERYPLRILQVINRYLFEELGFRGNTTDYYHPCNSFLNDVIDQRVGIPITLSLIYLDIAEQVSFPMAGVNFPGHFLIRPLENDMQVFVNPFHQGELLFLEDCRERLSQIYGHPVELQPSFFEAIAPRQFLARMLSNLKHVY
ncbi:MAG TPA: transglutaminase-like domain-containing protein, partial [Stenomitos sp.]